MVQSLLPKDILLRAYLTVHIYLHSQTMQSSELLIVSSMLYTYYNSLTHISLASFLELSGFAAYEYVYVKGKV